MLKGANVITASGERDGDPKATSTSSTTLKVGGVCMIGYALSRSGLLGRIRRFYAAELTSRPVLTKAWSAFVLGALSNLVAAYNVLRVRGGGWESLGLGHVLRAVKFGAMNAPPYSHYWYPLLDTLTDSFVVKICIDQLLWRPCLVAYTFIGMGLLQGQGWANVCKNMKERYPQVIFNGFKLWPAVQVFNLSLVPLNLRSLVLECVSFFWGVYVSTATASSAAKNTNSVANGEECDNDQDNVMEMTSSRPRTPSPTTKIKCLAVDSPCYNSVHTLFHVDDGHEESVLRVVQFQKSRSHEDTDFNVSASNHRRKKNGSSSPFSPLSAHSVSGASGEALRRELDKALVQQEKESLKEEQLQEEHEEGRGRSQPPSQTQQQTENQPTISIADLAAGKLSSTTATAISTKAKATASLPATFVPKMPPPLPPSPFSPNISGRVPSPPGAKVPVVAVGALAATQVEAERDGGEHSSVSAGPSAS